jgi:hypothetical protein
VTALYADGAGRTARPGATDVQTRTEKGIMSTFSNLVGRLLSKDAEPLPQPSPGAPTSELWRVAGEVKNGWFYIDDVPLAVAQNYLASFQARSSRRLTLCRRCPNGEVPVSMHAGHDADEGERGWRYDEMINLRIMPMREAL